MRPRLAVIFIFLVIMPLGLLGWLGFKLAKEEQARMQNSLKQVMEDRLADLNGVVARLIEDLERDMLRTTEFLPEDASNKVQQKAKIIQPEYNSNQLRALARRERFVKQFFVIGPNNRFQHPPTGKGLQTTQETRFFERTLSVWESGTRFYESVDDAWQAGPTQGWHTWFWGEGVNLLFWKRIPSGHIIGAEIEVVALQSELITRLPGRGDSTRRREAGGILLRDASGKILYQWGDHEPLEKDPARASLSVSAPFPMWTLEYYSSLSAGPGNMPVNLVASLLALATVLILMALYFYRENTRELRTASQKVTFVNQVSHELKTPLTNIRMYAEMLEDQVPEEDAKPRSYLKVITDECQRLSRLIGNVLTFAKSQRQELQLHKTPVIPDETIRNTLDHFRPALKSREFIIELNLDATLSQNLDSDLLGQVLGNLIGNVEKYASQGKYLGITSRQDKDTLVVIIEDHGPGIPASQQNAIFQPFQRLSNQLSDGVSGTGIGLSISRDLARLHGGDLKMEPSETGAKFKLTLTN